MNSRKAIVAAVAVVMCSGVCMARPGGFGRGFHRAPMHHAPRFHHHHGYGWGAAAGFVGGAIVGGIVHDIVAPRPVVVAPSPVVVTQPVVTQPVVVQQPVVVPQPVAVPQPVVVQQPVMQTQNVWVEGQYVDQVQANGTTVRVWQPGHYEQRQGLAQ